MTTPALRPARSVAEIVGSVRAIRYWVDEQIKAGRSDDEIVVMAPTAIAFINGDLSVAELVTRVEEGHPCST